MNPRTDDDALIRAIPAVCVPITLGTIAGAALTAFGVSLVVRPAKA